MRRYALALLGALSSCATREAPQARHEKGPAVVRVLYTADEHGWVSPAVEGGRARGGAAELTAQWRVREGLCVPSDRAACARSSSLALSGGDNWTGPAISSFFDGAVAVETMRAIGYAASALGNHDLDFGREVFAANAAREGFPYLAANVEPVRGRGGVAEPFALIERAGVRIGVVGLITHEAPREGMRENYEGLTFGDEEAALARTVPAAYAAGADAVVVVAHVCANDMIPIIERHPEWRLAFVGAAHCHRTSFTRVGPTPVVETGAFLRAYARVTVRVDRTRAAGDRVTGVDAEIIDLTYPEGESPPIKPDAAITSIVGSWQHRVDDALGEIVGFSNETFEADSPALANLITDAWRTATGADVALLNRHAMRQAIASGPIAKRDIYSMLPFRDRLVIMHITGEQLVHDAACCHAHLGGLRLDPRNPNRFVMDGGAPVDPRRRYTVVSTDFAYHGGSGFPFEQQDASPTFGDDWREPLLHWLRTHPTSQAHGLEAFVERTARGPAEKM